MNDNRIKDFAETIERDFGSVNLMGEWFLTIGVILSGVLSGIFFFQNTGKALEGIHPILAGGLGVVVGLWFSEGMLIAWHNIQTNKQDTTGLQLAVIWLGLATAALSSVFSTFAFFTSFEIVPPAIQNRQDGFVFLALLIPTACQILIYASYKATDRKTIDNLEKARLSVLEFQTFIETQKALTQAARRGQQKRIEAMLDDWGDDVGFNRADRWLDDGKTRIFTNLTDEEKAAKDRLRQRLNSNDAGRGRFEWWAEINGDLQLIKRSDNISHFIIPANYEYNAWIVDRKDNKVLQKHEPAAYHAPDMSPPSAINGRTNRPT